MNALAAPILNKVGLQLLLEPSSSSILFNSASVAVGAVYPAYATYKLLVRERAKPAPGSSGHHHHPASSSSSSLGGPPDADQLLKYWAVAGTMYVAERAAAPLLNKLPYYPHVKFALLMWLLMDRCKGAQQLFDCHLVPALLKYEVKVDVCLEAGYQAAAALWAVYRVPIQQATCLAAYAARQLLTFLKWLATPDDAAPGARPPTGTAVGSSSSSSSCGGGGGGGGVQHSRCVPGDPRQL